MALNQHILMLKLAVASFCTLDRKKNLSNKTLMKRHQGFTLVELVAVIVLISILSVSILPRFTSSDGFAEYAVRDQLVSAFRLSQQRAMYDHSGNCYRLNIDANGFGSQRDGAYFGPVGEVNFSGDYSDISVSPASPIYFDGLGNAFSDGCGVTPVTDMSAITILPSGVQIEIYSAGYIKVL